jgi:hypothetical protein
MDKVSQWNADWQCEQEREEEVMWEACIDTAIASGHTAEEAQECDNGSVGCPDCPFVEIKVEKS